MQSGLLRPQGGMSGSKRQFGGCTASIGTEGIANSPRQEFRKGERPRRMWTLREEEILASTLLELVARGWKSDNGFRAGGVGFNVDGNHKIDCDDDQWDQIGQADKDEKFMRTKSWPFWETWKCIFGKDRASGGGAEDIDKASERVRAQLASGSQVNENDYHPSFEDFPFDATAPAVETADHNDNSSGNSGKQTSTNKPSTLKRKQESTDAILMEFLGNLHAETNSRLELISARIGYEFDMGKARQDVFGKLGDVDGLTLDQRYELCDILADKPQRLEVFMGMPSTAHLGYVLRLIEHNR
ncbi:hypothetical protein AAHA92_15959 [Salvia divinorum]|uniref:Uncharacterized protein n=1 Tax=Salvia divinorum TaxID=28513 RepID=A0ABD1GU34_SALDI